MFVGITSNLSYVKYKYGIFKDKIKQQMFKFSFILTPNFHIAGNIRHDIFYKMYYAHINGIVK